MTRTYFKADSLEGAFRHHLPGEVGGVACVEWPGRIASTGYGRMVFRYRDYHAHRVSYTIHRGAIPDGLWVLHDPEVCNNPRCVNPDHLRLGTPGENQRDRRVAGTDIRGERVAGAKLENDDVIEIRRLRKGGATEMELAERYGVHRTSINLIINRKTWAHLPEEA